MKSGEIEVDANFWHFYRNLDRIFNQATNTINYELLSTILFFHPLHPSTIQLS